MQDIAQQDTKTSPEISMDDFKNKNCNKHLTDFDILA